MGWGGIITFMFLYTHRHGKLIIFSCCLADTGTALSSSVTAGVGWGGLGLGWDNNVHVLYTHRHSNRHCSFIITYCSCGVGWGGIITFMFLYTHRHGKLIIFLAVLQTQAQLFHHQLLLGWGEVGWGGVG